MAVEIKITIGDDNPFWRPFWAFINDPKFAHIFLKSQKSFADTSGEAATLDKLAKGRKIGQAEGARANKENAAERREAIIERAKEVWKRNPDFKNNMLATARAIRRMNDDVRRTGPDSTIGVETIRKHLSVAKKTNFSEKLFQEVRNLGNS